MQDELDANLKEGSRKQGNMSAADLDEAAGGGERLVTHTLFSPPPETKRWKSVLSSYKNTKLLFASSLTPWFSLLWDSVGKQNA